MPSSRIHAVLFLSCTARGMRLPGGTVRTHVFRPCFRTVRSGLRRGVRRRRPAVRSQVTVSGAAGTVGPTKGDVEDQTDEGLSELRCEQRRRGGRLRHVRDAARPTRRAPDGARRRPAAASRARPARAAGSRRRRATPTSLAAVIEIAERSGRADLAARLETSRERIRRTGVTVAVVGEFKKGKSSLVNALVNAEICPADPVDATVAPIVVAPRRAAHRHRRRPSRRRPTSGDLDRLRLVGSEAGNADNHLGVRRIDIAAPPPGARVGPRRRRHARCRRAGVGGRRA